jgi:DNA-binding IclR family transcriptional regulator
MDEIGGAQSIARGIGLLKMVAEGPPEGLTLAQVAERTGLHRATAHRLLAALTRERLLEQDATHRYHPGVELWVLGAAAARRFDIREVARPALERIASQTEDTVYLSVRSGQEAICVARCEGAFPIRTLSLNVGDRRPLGVGSGSLALLAFLAEADRQEVLGGIAAELARYPRFSPAAIRRLVDETRSRGYSLVGGTILPGMSAFGVPILDRHGHAIAALSVAAIDSRMAEPRLSKIVRLVQSQAVAVASRLSPHRRAQHTRPASRR